MVINVNVRINNYLRIGQDSNMSVEVINLHLSKKVYEKGLFVLHWCLQATSLFLHLLAVVSNWFLWTYRRFSLTRVILSPSLLITWSWISKEMTLRPVLSKTGNGQQMYFPSMSKQNESRNFASTFLSQKLQSQLLEEWDSEFDLTDQKWTVNQYNKVMLSCVKQQIIIHIPGLCLSYNTIKVFNLYYAISFSHWHFWTIWNGGFISEKQKTYSTPEIQFIVCVICHLSINLSASSFITQRDWLFCHQAKLKWYPSLYDYIFQNKTFLTWQI